MEDSEWTHVWTDLPDLASSDQSTQQKNFIFGLQNARNLLKGLENSLRKTAKYEEQLLRCKSTHSHTHSGNEWWDSEVSEDKEKYRNTGVPKISRRPVDLAESWSTMSIVCLQYQYEELTKRYESLLQAYNDRCNVVSARENALERLQQHANAMHTQLVDAHTTLIFVGEKFLALKHKAEKQKSSYMEIINNLKDTVKGVVRSTERARLQLNKQLARSMETEQDALTALLLAEIRKCNILYLENLRLKVTIEELCPGYIDWEL